MGLVAVTYKSTVDVNISTTVDEYSVPLVTAAGNNRLIVGIVNYRATTIRTTAGVTYDGVAGTVWQNAGVDGGLASGSSVFYVDESQLPAAPGTYTFSITRSGSANSARPVVFYELTGVDQTTPLSNWVVNLLTAVADLSTQSATLSSASGKLAIGYVAASAASNFSFDISTPPTQADASYLPPSLDGVYSSRLMAMHDAVVASGSEQYDWIMVTGGISIDSMVVAAFVVNAAAGGSVVAKAQGLQNLSAQFAAVSAARLGGVLQ